VGACSVEPWLPFSFDLVSFTFLWMAILIVNIAGVSLVCCILQMCISFLCFDNGYIIWERVIGGTTTYLERNQKYIRQNWPCIITARPMDLFHFNIRHSCTNSQTISVAEHKICAPNPLVSSCSDQCSISGLIPCSKQISIMG
jgi:hypothetical protein